MVIRPYRPADREAVRRICCDTADRGGPVEGFFDDREIFADLLTGYYMDCEPEALWVAEQDGRATGYLTGCLDTRRFRRVMAFRVVPAAVLRAFARGAPWRGRTWRLAAAGWRTWRLGGRGGNGVPLDAYPAHLHLNLREECRGAGAGRGLLGRFLEQVASAGLPGVHAAVRGDNPAACRFFERMGFTALSRHPAVLPEGGGYRFHETIIYGRPMRA